MVRKNLRHEENQEGVVRNREKESDVDEMKWQSLGWTTRSVMFSY